MDVELCRKADEVVNTFKCLVQGGLDLMVEDNDQRSALDVAAAWAKEGILAHFRRGNQVDLRAESKEEDEDEDEGGVLSVTNYDRWQLLGASKDYLNLVRGSF